ncbi:MAG: universal stress protein [Bacteroidetes bacterium]|nr:universal stress protein [Bacteroidota bacterium]
MKAKKTAKNLILVPFDFDGQTEPALDYAAKIAGKTRSEIILYHVMMEEGFFSGLLISAEQVKVFREGITMKLQSLADGIADKYKVKVTPVVEQGKPYEKIIKAAEKMHPRIVVMGRKKSSDVIRNFLGTNTLNVVRASSMPVICVKKQQKAPHDLKILLPLDLSKETRNEVSAAIDLAGFMKASLHIVSILNVDSAGLEIVVSTQLEKIRKIVEKYGIVTTAQVIRKAGADIPEEILKCGRKAGAGMIMIFTQKEVNFIEYFMGSTAQNVLRESELPVLSLVPGKDNKNLVDHTLVDPFIKNIVDPLSILD